MSGSRRNAGWVPRQHGAWAMLVVPFLAGVVAHARHSAPTGRWWAAVAAVFVAWMLGYFAFAAASLWLKARPARRAQFTRPVAVYSLVAGAAGVVALLLQPSLAWWVPVYAVLTGLTLLLVHHGDERSVASGLLTTVAAGLIAATVQAPTPAAATAEHWSLAAVCAAYFFGTVLYVKTLIRERGKPLWVQLSVSYHLTAAAVCFACLLLSLAGGMDLGWGPGAWGALTCFFGVCSVRAAAVPLLGPMRGRRVTPKQAGIGEAVLSAILAAVLFGL